MITIKLDEYNGLYKDRLKLTMLENNGVDNWPGYNDVMADYNKWLDEEETI
jgi:hypothetical protein